MSANEAADWKDFFVFSGTCGATLLGLLFVSISFNSHKILADQEGYPRRLAQQAYLSYIMMVMSTLLFLMPGYALPQRLAAMGALGLGGLVLSARLALAAWRRSHARSETVHIFRRLAPPALSYMMMIAVMAGAIRNAGMDMVALLVPAQILLLVSATATAWDLLVRVGSTKVKSD